jgi:hypothetical protein
MPELFIEEISPYPPDAQGTQSVNYHDDTTTRFIELNYLSVNLRNLVEIH